jgi:hypothetical protein
MESVNTDNSNLKEQDVSSTHYKNRQVYFIEHCAAHENCHKMKKKDKPVV